MKRLNLKAALLMAVAVQLSACGGGSTGSSVASVSPPPASPPPPPPSGQSPFGVTADTEFATIGDDLEFRWIESAKAYEIRFSGAAWERLTFASGDYYPQSGFYGITLGGSSTYRYTNSALQFENGWGFPIGLFAYGIPTAVGDVPITGTASYQASVRGRASQGTEPWAYNISGTGQLIFDFGAGTLSGHFDPLIDNWNGDVRALGRYDFVNTVYSAGNTRFSGDLRHASLDQLGIFQGLFTGPQAAELMAEWRAPYRNPWTSQLDTISGIWIGKKD